MPLASNDAVFNRGTGLLVIEVRHSNPNGDPDAESEPRTLDADGRGLISPVSFKRKLRDLIADQEGPVWQHAERALKLRSNGGRKFGILESRGRDREAIFKMSAGEFADAFWDGRVFGNTFLEDIKGKFKPGEKDHFISTGTVQFGPGISVAPIEVERLTTTNKSGVEEGKDRGMAPLGWRVVRHGVYLMPFFVNPMMAAKSGCGEEDIALLKFLVPHAYHSTASAVRPFVEVRHAWYAEHTSPLGSCPDSLILDALKPKKIAGGAETPSTSIEEYDIPTQLPEEVRRRLASFEDLCDKQWG
ncbi:MAG TPA: type I CRISPR-associated protein Cas7 [Thermoanaerobaculia bacterium]|nr:type I CRISPR-associated protein Cas7 [Thermoanaerobaculia bacterium]